MNEEFPEDRVYTKARVAVFTMYENRQIPQLVLHDYYSEAEEHNTFSHWGTEEFLVDVTPVEEIEEDELPPPKRYA